MLTGIRNPSAGPAGDPLLRALTDCHERIRRFTQMARRLAEIESAPPAELAEAAAAVHRYFTVALPLHAADEERSIEPRLVERAPELAGRLAQMKVEHEEIEALVAELAPAWRAIADDPAEHAARRGALAAPTSRLEALFERHLPPEEREIFPAVVRLIAPEERARALAEMQGRRAR